MMLVVSKSKQARQDRVNVDSMVSFDGIDQYADAGVNPNVINAIDVDTVYSVSFFLQFTDQATANRIFSISNASVDGSVDCYIQKHDTENLYRIGCFFQKLDSGAYRVSRSDYILRPNALYHIVVRKLNNGFRDSPGNTTTLDFIVNTIPYPVASVSGVQGLDVTAHRYDSRLYIGALVNSNGVSPVFPGLINHLVFCNRAVTINEASQMHSKGGIVPRSLHSAVVAHYPCTHSEGDVLVDVVEQYNYAKPLSNIYINYGSNNDGSGEWTKSNGASVNLLATYITIGNSATTSKRIYTPTNGLSKYRYIANIRTARATGVFEVYQDNILIAASNGFGNINNGNLTQNVSFDFEVAGSFEIRYRQTDQGAGSSSDLFHDTLKNTKALTPYHAYLQGFADSEHTGAAQTAWKDFYSKLPVANYGVHFASNGSEWTGTHINNTPLVGNSWSTMIEFTPTTQNSYPNDNYSFRFGFDTVLQFRIRGNQYAQKLLLQHLNNVVQDDFLTGTITLNQVHKIILTYDVDSRELTCYHGNAVRVFSNVPPISATNGYYQVNESRYSISAYALFRNVWYNKSLSVKEVAELQSGKELDSAFMDYAFTDFEGVQNRIGSQPTWPLSYTGGTGQIIDRELQPPFTNKSLQIQATSKAQRILLDSLTESWSGEMHFFLYLDSVPSGAERYLFTSQHNSSQTHFYIENGNRLKFENKYGPGLIRMRSDVISIQKGWNHFGIRCGSVANSNSFKFYHQGRYVGNNVVTNNYNSIYSDFFPKYISRQYLFTAWSSSNNTFPANTQIDCRLVAFYANRSTFTKSDKEILEAYNNGLFQGLNKAHTVLYGDYNNVHTLSDANSNFTTGHSWATGEGWYITGDTLQFTGAGGGRNSSVAVNGIGDGVSHYGKKIMITVNVSAIARPSGGNGIGLALGSTSNKKYINSVGSHTYELTYEGGGQGRLFISNDNGADSYTITSIMVWWYNVKDIGNARSCVLENYTPNDESPIIPIDRLQSGELDTKYSPYPTVFGSRTARISWNTDVDETKFSVSFWYYATGYNGSTGANNLFFAGLAGGGYVTVKYQKPSEPLYFVWTHTGDGNNNAERTSIDVGDARVGNWTHIALTIEQNVEGKINRHGYQVSSADNVFLAGAISYIGFFGSADGNENPAPAFVRNLQVYNGHVLTTAEINELRALGYNAINPPIHLVNKLSLHAPCMQKSGVPMDLISGKRAYMEESRLQWATIPG
ncbi:hypothetical protein OKW21_005050 [Catalinimonas alkaloidigena]|uniref:LamG-like jellyroll fold domain-containing protein n=1 Tax=Catalinimonas alkaloidigena TaxID=1075417 RepID=UPI002404F1BE|nr:LamG-like jellyroll fold domain-containing protein [Catalinimonas alkaloidigena]MDF9799787.1 hypothetical protein [Catalinimonas alkaloidigena]